MSQTADAQDLNELLDVVDRLSQEFSTVPARVLMDVVLACRSDLSCAPLAALPELVERLARVRLTPEG